MNTAHTTALARLDLIASDHRCECPGDCGRAHRKNDDGRCHVVNSPAHPLCLVAPGRPLAEAAALDRHALAAWCPGCIDHAAKTTRALLADQPDLDQLDIFDALNTHAPTGHAPTTQGDPS